MAMGKSCGRGGEGGAGKSEGAGGAARGSFDIRQKNASISFLRHLTSELICNMLRTNRGCPC